MEPTLKPIVSTTASKQGIFKTLKLYLFREEKTARSVALEHLDLAKKHMGNGQLDEASKSLGIALSNARCINEFSGLRQSGLMAQEIEFLQYRIEKIRDPESI